MPLQKRRSAWSCPSGTYRPMMPSNLTPHQQLVPGLLLLLCLLFFLFLLLGTSWLRSLCSLPTAALAACSSACRAGVRGVLPGGRLPRRPLDMGLEGPNGGRNGTSTATDFSLSFSFSLFLPVLNGTLDEERERCQRRRHQRETGTARRGTSPKERRTVRSLLCGPGSERLPGRISWRWCASCTTSSLAPLLQLHLFLLRYSTVVGVQLPEPWRSTAARASAWHAVVALDVLPAGLKNGWWRWWYE